MLGTVKTRTCAREGKPLRRADIAAGKLVLRKRGAGGAVLPNKTIREKQRRI